MSEKELQAKCNKHLRDIDVKFIHLEKGRTHKGRTHRGGIPDLIIFKGSEKVFFIELKVGKGKLKPEQIDFMNWAIELNYSFYVCYSFDEFTSILDYELHK